MCRDYCRAEVRGRGDSRSRRRRRTMLDGSGVMLSRRARSEVRAIDGNDAS